MQFYIFIPGVGLILLILFKPGSTKGETGVSDDGQYLCLIYLQQTNYLDDNIGDKFWIKIYSKRRD